LFAGDQGLLARLPQSDFEALLLVRQPLQPLRKGFQTHIGTFEFAVHQPTEPAKKARCNQGGEHRRNNPDGSSPLQDPSFG
jgi:hypothetical protein